MKNFLFVAIAALAVGLVGCQKDGGNNPEPVQPPVETRDYLIVKIANSAPAPESRVVTPPATSSSNITLRDGVIFILDASGSVIARPRLNPTQATSAGGQTISTPVATNSRVYIIGNLPTGFDETQYNNFTQIDQAVQSLSRGNQPTSYANAMVANSPSGQDQTGQPVQIAVTSAGTPGTPGAATVSLSLSPLYSRLELYSVRGATTPTATTAFTVTGVFVDSYYSQFTLTGKAAGAVKSQGQSTVFTDNIGDTGSWAAGGSPLKATPNAGGADTPNVWAYHMASADLPRLIIQLQSVTPTPPTSAGAGPNYYLTVTGYNGTQGNAVPVSFQRGRIYRIGADANGTPDTTGANSLTIDPNKLSPTPNPDNVSVRVNVTVSDWTIVPLTPQV